MKVYNHLNEFPRIANPVVTIGMFDGVHLGHRKLVDRLTEAAQEINGETVVLSFFPHPRMILSPEPGNLRLLNSLDEKIDLLSKTGLNHMIIHPFDKEFSEIPSQEFIQKILVGNLGVKKLVIGYDHHFGKDRSGSFEELRSAGAMYDFEVEEIPSQDIENISISSTKIRHALQNGDLDLAEKFLGYQYTLSGIVAAGNKIGRTLNFPTANIFIEEKLKLIPRQGVYAVKVDVGEKSLKGMLNIGNRPTFPGKDFSIEVHIFDFNEDIYGETIKVHLVSRVRDEVKFDSAQSLEQQLNKDRENIKSILK